MATEGPTLRLPPHEDLEPRSIAKEVILTLITCGLWGLVWQYQQIRMVNLLLGREEFSFWKWFVFTLLTCGLYHLYHEYLMGRAIVRIQHKYGLPPSESLPAISLIVTLLSLGIITDALQQKELNLIIEDLKQKSR
ncbi:DUF4234 domain-containing protein [Thermodesulfatator atlanticus]|uniref:DUF4234 domain-containing protein n=1 Tax=Thermodesulfatator atlanticus TaxID=501497 RepID=UPI0003B34377|nr:DUF4234 domain-containing protein [Thermodesulfatator atlanticus]